ncbi:MAG: SLC13 family permease [Myxococcales bacterium]|nr:SLC13 family permease [Myxococcales bacterium]
MNWLGVGVFVFTYVLISTRRVAWLGLDRPAGALLGAVACVLLGVLSPADAIGAINGPTLLLLFGVMGIGAFLALDGFFDTVELAIVRVARTPVRLLGTIVWGAGVLAAFITNDAVCVLGAPVVVRLIERHRLPPLPFLLALATGANTGSVATLVGNPQNMLCALLGQLSYREHLLRVAPLALLCLAINHGMLALMFKRHIEARELEASVGNTKLDGRTWVTLAVIAATAVAYTAGADLAWAATAGFVALMLLHRRDTRLLWPRIDWSLLLFFGGLFVVVEAFVQSGAPARLFAHFPLGEASAGGLSGWLRIATIFLVGSNAVSNVPFILVVRAPMATLANPTLGWELLAVASTFAGNLTLLGSVANIIVAESARDLGGIGFVEHLKVGLPLALLTTLVGTLWLTAVWPG